MARIQLVTTKGCEGCRIMDKLILQSLKQTKSDTNGISYIKTDFNDCNKDFIKENNITDFPTTIFIKNDNVLYKHVGTVPVYTISSWILKYLF